jgi:salicylate hydroxylase
MADRSILVAGGGIAGLSAAIGLARTGQSIHILEQAEAFNRVGAGLQIGPNAVRALRALGAWEDVKPLVYYPPEIHIRDGVRGRLLDRVVLGRDFENQFGAPYGVAHRSDLHAALLNVANRNTNIETKMAVEISAGQSDGNSVTLRTASAAVLEGICLIAADGIDSQLRRQNFGSRSAVHLPFTLHRMSAPLSQVKADLALDCVNLWLLPGGHVVHYPIAGATLNIVAVTDGIGTGLTGKLSTPLSDVLASSQSTGFWPVKHVPSLRHWHTGLVCLTGDAAHGTVPFLAQGAAMALEDAVSLASHFRIGDVRSGFDQFEAARKDRCARLDVQSRRMGHIYHQSGVLAACRNAAMGMIPAGFAARSMDWIYRGS